MAIKILDNNYNNSTVTLAGKKIEENLNLTWTATPVMLFSTYSPYYISRNENSIQKGFLCSSAGKNYSLFSNSFSDSIMDDLPSSRFEEDEEYIEFNKDDEFVQTIQVDTGISFSINLKNEILFYTVDHYSPIMETDVLETYTYHLDEIFDMLQTSAAIHSSAMTKKAKYYPYEKVLLITAEIIRPEYEPSTTYITIAITFTPKSKEFYS